MHPTQNKEQMKRSKSTAKQLLGQSSAWQAHLKRVCLNHCHYCWLDRLNLPKWEWRLPDAKSKS